MIELDIITNIGPQQTASIIVSMFGVEVAEAERGELPAGGRGPPRPRAAAEQSHGPRTNILM